MLSGLLAKQWVVTAMYAHDQLVDWEYLKWLPNLATLQCTPSTPLPPLQATLPESPRWLLLSGAGKSDAFRALVRCEGRRAANLPLVEAEIDEMAANIKDSQAFNAASRAAHGSSLVSTLGLDLFQDSRYYRPLLVGMSLMLFQQVRQMGAVVDCVRNLGAMQQIRCRCSWVACS